MKTWGVTGKQWLKSIHLIVSVVWLGGGICLSVLPQVWVTATDSELYALNHTIGLLDNWIIVPSAFASLITGLFESWFTNWGFFKFRWVTLKWIGTIALMLYGPLFQSRWETRMEAISRVEGLLALQNPAYLEARLLFTISGVGMVAALAFMSIISTLKPWTRKDRLNAKPTASSVPAEA